MSRRNPISLLSCWDGFPVYPSFTSQRAARTRAQTDRPAASLLLPRNVFAPAYDRPQRGGLDAGFSQRGLFDGGIAVAAETRLRVAEQLTAGPGYDYQPDCASDGRWVVYASYAKDAVELWALDLETKRTRQLTTGGAVNVEPRFSPDGKQIAFVSTSFHGHFHILRRSLQRRRTENVQRMTGENRSTLQPLLLQPIRP